MGTASGNYLGFISYSHTNKRDAHRLLRMLHAYRLPREIAKKNSDRRLGQFFMDRDSLPAAGDLSNAIMRGLCESGSLIVLCSPEAAASSWVVKEIEAFKSVNPSGHIYAVIAPSVRNDLHPTDCFPPPLTMGGLEPLAADLRSSGDGSKLGLLKLAAALTGSRLESLIRREQSRQRRRVTLVTAVTTSVALAMSALAATAVMAQQEAELRRADAEGLADFMITDLRDRLEPVGRLDALDGVADQVLDYYERLDNKLDCDSGVRYARALNLQAEVAVNSRNDELFQQSASRGWNFSKELSELCPSDASVQFSRGQSAFWGGYAAWFSSDLETARDRFSEYHEISLSLVSADPEIFDFQKELAASLVNLGVFEDASGDYLAARVWFEQAIQKYDELADHESADIELMHQHADTIGWLAKTYERNRDWSNAEAMRIREATRARDIEEYSLRTFDRSDWAARFVLHSSQRAMARIQYLQNHMDAAREQAERSVTGFERLVAHDNENLEWVSGMSRSLVIQAEAERALGQFETYQLLQQKVSRVLVEHPKLTYGSYQQIYSTLEIDPITEGAPK